MWCCLTPRRRCHRDRARRGSPLAGSRGRGEAWSDPAEASSPGHGPADTARRREHGDLGPGHARDPHRTTVWAGHHRRFSFSGARGGSRWRRRSGGMADRVHRSAPASRSNGQRLRLAPASGFGRVRPRCRIHRCGAVARDEPELTRLAGGAILGGLRYGSIPTQPRGDGSRAVGRGPVGPLRHRRSRPARHCPMAAMRHPPDRPNDRRETQGARSSKATGYSGWPAPSGLRARRSRSAIGSGSFRAERPYSRWPDGDGSSRVGSGYVMPKR
jgi:hypothetical protein